MAGGQVQRGGRFGPRAIVTAGEHVLVVRAQSTDGCAGTVVLSVAGEVTSQGTTREIKVPKTCWICGHLIVRASDSEGVDRHGNIGKRERIGSRTGPCASTSGKNVGVRAVVGGCCPDDALRHRVLGNCGRTRRRQRRDQRRGSLRSAGLGTIATIRVNPCRHACFSQ